MLLKSTGFVLLVVIASAVASLGPPPGSRGTIDFRYPDYIVEPRPSCLSEGVFPHPRNCSWYYRCHDPYEIGYYHQNYFECEPGTVFSDALDQCIHPFNPNYPCQTAPITVPTTSAPPSVPDCFDSMIRCKVYLCPNPNGVMGNVGRLCQSAFSMCINGTSVSLCTQSQFFDVLTRMCVTPPGQRGCVEEDVFDSTATPPRLPPTTPTAPTTTVAPPTLNPNDCYDSMVECKHYQCARTRYSRKEYLCRKAFQTCNRNQVTFYCNSPSYFHYDDRECVDPPEQQGCVEVEAVTTTPAPTTSMMIDPSLITFTFTVECSVTTPRPREPTLSQYYCSNYDTCRRGVNTQIELCSKYLQCVRSNNSWKAIVMDCPPGLYFSYDNDLCLSKPDGICKQPNLI